MGSSTSDLTIAIDAVLGVPFGELERGPLRFDCFGLAAWLTRAVAGVDVAGPTDRPYEARDVVAIRDRFARVDGEPQALDWLLVRAPRRQHVAVVESRAWAVEALPGLGVVRTPLSELLRQRPEVYRLK